VIPIKKKTLLKMEAYICISNKKIMTDYRPIIEAAWEDRSLLEQAETPGCY